MLRHDYKVSGGVLIRTETQPDENRILQANQEVRRNPDALRNLSFAGLELRIPEIAYYALRKKYPELNSPDAEIRTKAWRRFLATSEADEYRMRPKRRARAVDPVTRRRQTSRG